MRPGIFHALVLMTGEPQMVGAALAGCCIGDTPNSPDNRSPEREATIHFTDCCTAGTPMFPEKGSLEEMKQTSLAEGCTQVMGPCDKIPSRLEG